MTLEVGQELLFVFPRAEAGDPESALLVPGMVIAAVAAGVYLVDVRPKLLEVQGKSR